MPEKSHSFRGADREGARRSAAENSLGGEARRDALDSRSSSLRDMVVQRSGEANSSDTHRETGKDVDEIREELMRRVSRSGGRAYPSSSPPRRRDRDAFRRASADERASFMPEALTGLAREVATETKWQSRRFYRSVRIFHGWTRSRSKTPFRHARGDVRFVGAPRPTRGARRRRGGAAAGLRAHRSVWTGRN